MDRLDTLLQSALIDPAVVLRSSRVSRIYSDEGYSLPADMWSVGVIVFALMGGRFPYKEVEPKALADEARATKLYFPPNPWNGVSENGPSLSLRDAWAAIDETLCV